jgi:hypothetical protein
VVDDVALRLEVLDALHLDREAVTHDVDKRLLDGGRGVPVALDPHRVPNAQLLLLDLEQLASGGVMKNHRVPQPQRLPSTLRPTVPEGSH